MSQAGYETLEKLREKNCTPYAVYAGVKAANGWCEGRNLTDAEYKAAVAAFEAAPMDGREVR